MSTRRTVSLRFRSRARLIAATVVLQALVVGAVSFAAIRGIQYFFEQRLDAEYFTEGTRIVDEYAGMWRLPPGEKLPVVPDRATWGVGAVLKTQLRERDVKVPLGYTVIAFHVMLEVEALADGTESPLRKEIMAESIATTPESDFDPKVWQEAFREQLAERDERLPASEVVTSRSQLTVQKQHDEHTDKQRVALAITAVPLWESLPYEENGKTKVRSGWMIVMSHASMDQSEQVSRAMLKYLKGWFVCVGVLVIGTSVLGTMVFARRYDTKIHQMNDDLERAAQDSSRRALQIRNGMIFGLAKLADYRDTDTGQHLERISQYCAMLAHELMDDFPEINQAWIEKLRVASSMHDIGKVGIPDYILLKPGALTATERKIMENHPIIGADTLIAIRRRSGDDELLNIAIQVTLSHHERFDGKGYPFGLSRDQIPLAARIVALSDMYDALTSKRVYKAAMSHEEAKRIIREGSGTQFDPKIVNAFIRIQRKFDETRREMAHDDVAMPHAKTPPVNEVPGPDALPTIQPEKPEIGRDRRAA